MVIQFSNHNITAEKSMIEIDFFGTSGARTIEERRQKVGTFIPNSEIRSDFMGFGYDYFDNADYGVGYGGYFYDGRYEKSAADMVKHYELTPKDNILEIGCAKGFVLCEFLSHGVNVAGIDLSHYALKNAVPLVRPFLLLGSCVALPWPDNTFDLVYAKEILPHLALAELAKALPEIVRVSKSNNIFLEIQVIADAKEEILMKTWDETHKTIETADWWLSFLEKQNFIGQVHFKRLF